jgi:hypothetical protein
MKQSLGALEYFFPPDFAASLAEESFLRRLLCAQDSRAKIRRQHISDCLEVALRYKLASADLEARLRKGNHETFSATINELKCAKFLEGLFGIGSLRWHPQGRKGKVGEFEAFLSNLDAPIFVEVKTIVRRELERVEDRIVYELRQCAEEVAIPCSLNVTIKKAGCSDAFSKKGFRKFLETELRKVNVGNAEKVQTLPDYRDERTSLHLEIRTSPIPGARLQACVIGIIAGESRFSEDHVYIRHSLKKAEEKLPKEKPCLVLLCSSTGFPIDQDDMLNALLGTLAVRYELITDELASNTREPEAFREPDGFYQPRRNRKLSATGVYEENFTEEGVEGKLEIYHNPWAANLLDYSIFGEKGVHQLIKVSEGHMQWRN